MQRGNQVIVNRKSEIVSSVQASWLLPGDGRVIRDGVLRMRGGLVEAVGPAGEVPPAREHRTLEGVAILPGLVNAHTHLELSHLRGLLPRRASMPRWILGLLRRRGTREQRQAAVESGARELLSTGTTTVADISHDNSAWPVLARSPLRKLCFAEVIGISPDPRAAMARLEKTLEGLPPCDQSLRFGISPHAPYSTSENLYREAMELARRRCWPVCTHLAETRGERQFLMRGGGVFLKFLQTMALVDDSFAAARCRPLELAKRVGLLAPRDADILSACREGILPSLLECAKTRKQQKKDKDADKMSATQQNRPDAGGTPAGHADKMSASRTESPVMLAHVNYLDDEELALLAASRASVVYCPGSSAFFGRSGHRYAQMLAAGVNVAVGTDSLASNDRLDMLAEMRRLRRQGRVDNHTILRMATINGAVALGWDDRIGSLAPGKAADWIAVELPPRVGSDVLESILTHPCKVTETVISGRTSRV